MVKRHFKLRPGKIALVASSLVMACCLSFGLVLSGCSAKSIDPPSMPDDGKNYSLEYETSTVVGYSAEYLGTTARSKPVKEVKNGGLDAYPTYGYTLQSVIGGEAEKVAARNALINESSYLTATGTSNAGGGNYKWMDKDGYLYNGTTAEPEITYDRVTGEQRRLYQHTASVGLYLGNVDDNEPGIIKKVTMRPRGYSSYGVTGVYAPAGEVIKIEMSEADMDATGGIIIHIGQALYNGQANNIWAEKGQMQRIPHLLNTMVVSKDTATLKNGVYTAYVGSFIGGPIYIRNEGVTFSATISGGVAYSHFILGYTTEEEFEMNAQSSAPYFDLEVWQTGVLHSGPAVYAKDFSYDDLYNVAILWDKVSSVAITNGSAQGIVFLYDPFVAAGAAVAFPGRSSVNCPMSWMPSSLNYNSIVTSGSWGNFHEYHHNFQNFGIGYTGEVTNNALTLVSYSLFTKISATRQLPSYGAQGLGGWNNYTSATWSIQQVNANNINSTSGLAVYSTLLHNFGQDAFINARGYSGVNYFNRWADITHQDFSYFASKVVTYAGVDYSSTMTANDYPMFVPVASVYQTGRSYMYDNEKRYIETMQPYVIPYGQKFTVDLNAYKVNSAGQYESGSVVIGNGFDYTIKKVDASKANGTFVKTGDGIYTFTPNSQLLSGKIYVTLEVTTKSGEHTYNGKTLDDVDLVLEFQQSHETNKNVLERTIYTYTDANMITDAREAYDSNFGKYSSVETIDHTNPTQNSNTDIWFYPNTDANHTAYPNAPDHYFFQENTISVIEGKLYFQEAGKYSIYLRGRKNCAFYYSEDNGKTYKLGGYITSGNSTAFSLNNEDTYCTVEIEEAGTWIYFKEVLISDMVNASQASYIGLGVGTWTDPLYTTKTIFYDKDGNVVDADSPDVDHSETEYYNEAGIKVDASMVSTEKVAPKSASYATAYRADYDFTTGIFESDYFYVKNVKYSYAGDPVVNSTWDEGVNIVDGTAKGESDTYSVYKILEEDTTTYLHTAANGGKDVYLTFDMGKTITANSITFLGRTDKAATTAQQGLPAEFTVEISNDGVNFEDAGTYTSSTGGAYQSTVNLGKDLTFRYIKITFKSTHSNTGRLILSGIKFTYQFSLAAGNNNVIEPDRATLNYSTGWAGRQTHSTYGHIYIGNTDATVSFEFTGTRLAILSSAEYGGKFEVTIDGKKISSIDLNEPSGDIYFSYLSEKLSSGKHKVVIKCLDVSSIDSFAVYDEG